MFIKRKKKNAKDIPPVMAFPYDQVHAILFTKHDELVKLTRDNPGLMSKTHEPTPQNDVVLKFLSLTVELRTVLEAIEKASDIEIMMMHFDPGVTRTEMIPKIRGLVTMYQESLKELALIPGGIGVPDEIPFFGNMTSQY